MITPALWWWQVVAGGDAGGPADLYESLHDLLSANNGLEASFGRDDWLWIARGPVGEELPYAVLVHLGDEVEGLPIGGAGSLPHTVNRTFEVRVYDTDRGNARGLGEAMASVIEAGAGAGSLLNDEAEVIDCTRTGNQGDEMDPDPAPDGGDVWSYRVEFIAMLNRT